MKEDFLQFIWRYQYFSTSQLFTTDGELIYVNKNGFYNTDAGPDFQEAIIEIGGVKWAGHVEVHVHSSDWLKHGHQSDSAYKNVVLHVVWEHDQDLGIPTLELKEVVSIELIEKYQFLQNNLDLIPCQTRIDQVNELTKVRALEQAFFQRLERKAEEVVGLYQESRDWLEVAYQLLMKYMGGKVNNEACLELSKILPLKVLLKHRDHPIQLEALLFGQAGLIKGKDEYAQLLRKEYQFLSVKYKLKESLELSRWKFLRLRPANFPTMRLAQVASLIHKEANLFSLFLEVQSPKQLEKLIQISVSGYWKTHYQFGKIRSSEINGLLGQAMLNNIAINVVVPLKFGYAIYQQNEEARLSVIDFISDLPPEKNSKVKKLIEVGFKLGSAFDTQAGIELLDNFCNRRKCLICPIGVSILNK